MTGADSHGDALSLDDFDALRRELEATDPAFAAAWAASAAKRSVALALIGLRRRAGLTQADLAARTGWNRGFVSRLESALGGVPNTATIARYAEACGAVATIAFAVGGQVVDMVPLSAPSPASGDPAAGPAVVRQAAGVGC